MAIRRKGLAAKKRASKCRLSFNVEAKLAARIEAAAASYDLSVSAYVAQILEEWVPKKNAGRVTAKFIRRADELRRQQKVPFAEDSVDLIREAREERDAQMDRVAGWVTDKSDS
jgi:hypothetical protein